MRSCTASLNLWRQVQSSSPTSRWAASGWDLATSSSTAKSIWATLSRWTSAGSFSISNTSWPKAPSTASIDSGNLFSQISPTSSRCEHAHVISSLKSSSRFSRRRTESGTWLTCRCASIPGPMGVAKSQEKAVLTCKALSKSILS